MCDNFHYQRFYDSHKQATLGKFVDPPAVFLFSTSPKVCLGIDPVEQEIIASSTIPIYVFWNSLLRIQNPERWPQDRKFVSWSSRSATGLFVTYQSTQDPLTTLGRLGDIWVTAHCVYYKEAENTWTPWRQGSPFYCCPYENQRVLTWLRSAHFTYISVVSRKKERTRWKGMCPYSLLRYVCERLLRFSERDFAAMHPGKNTNGVPSHSCSGKQEL